MKFQETKDPRQRSVGGPDGTGGAWGTPVVENGLVYFGIANPYRSLNQATKTPNDVLYNDSTVALDENTGKLKWYYQGVPNDFYDWDMQIGPMYTATGPGGQPTVIDAGKMGYVYAMNATTGKLDWKTPVGKHNGHDHDGRAGVASQAPRQDPVQVVPGFLRWRRDADGDGGRCRVRRGQQPVHQGSQPEDGVRRSRRSGASRRVRAISRR